MCVFLILAVWTTLTDYLPFVDGQAADVTSFKHRDEIFDSHAMDEYKVVEDSFLTTDISLVSVGWNFVHTIIIAYVLFKLNVIGSTAAVATIAAARLHPAAALDSHLCRMEDDLYYLLYAILVLCALAFIPPLIFKLYRFLTDLFWESVDVQAARRVAEGD